MNRRNFVRSTGMAVVGGMMAPACGARASGDDAEGSGLSEIGVQLYTVRDQMQESVPHTLAAVAEAGYSEVEFAGYFGHPAADIRGFLGEFGLTAPATHVTLDSVRDNPVATIAQAAEIGHEYVVVAWIGPEERTRDGYLRVCDDFNSFGERCGGAGLTFAYHNHDFEFARVGDEVAYDLLLSRCEPRLVKMELDLFWIRKGGYDPLPYFARHPGRFPLCHVKDMDATETMVDVGDGVIDFAQIFARSDQAGLEHYFVEHDNPADSLRSIERSYRFLADLRF